MTTLTTTDFITAITGALIALAALLAVLPRLRLPRLSWPRRRPRPRRRLTAVQTPQGLALAPPLRPGLGGNWGQRRRRGWRRGSRGPE